MHVNELHLNFSVRVRRRVYKNNIYMTYSERKNVCILLGLSTKTFSVFCIQLLIW